MPSTIVTDIGIINIADEIIAAVAGYAAIENYGLVGMSPKTMSDSLVSLIKRDNYKRGVVVRNVDNQVEIDLHIMCEYGVSLIAVAENIRKNVRYRVEELTGVSVACVNVNIEGIRVNS